MSQLREYFVDGYSKSGLISAKLDHYFEIYEELFSHLQEKPLRIVEIGVRNGGSLYMWNKYFHNAELILGIDIDEKCKSLTKLTDDGVVIEIGDQADRDFLQRIGKQYGPFDIIIDDGGHQFHQQKTSLNVLFEYLTPKGLYVMEDTHSSYDNYADLYPKDGVYGGGLGQKHTGIEYCKGLADKVTNWAYLKEHGVCPLNKPNSDDIREFFHRNAIAHDLFDTNLYSITFYDSIVALKKRQRMLPFVVFNNTTGENYNNCSKLF